MFPDVKCSTITHNCLHKFLSVHKEVVFAIRYWVSKSCNVKPLVQFIVWSSGDELLRVVNLVDN